jgi:hypothetical protein
MQKAAPVITWRYIPVSDSADRTGLISSFRCSKLAGAVNREQQEG